MKRVKEEIEAEGMRMWVMENGFFPLYSGQDWCGAAERETRGNVMGGLTGVPISIQPYRLSGHSLGDE